ncbi:TP53-regulated inhibitor of apoptosis 1-B-like [Melanaphis sacchari]|uniref:TP53-regulated inhibitor of apoptosis 1-B-like n=1 Tax=Melanaphis sacchari TaxID=742174 RepID=UPI000DC13279|nr:TP53-regulated inhibitor of apoptosis 1-B-like [Melanaphis sacchari]
MDECKSFKKEYDKCFNTWFRDNFLKGSNDDSMCSELLKNYTECIKKAMKDKDIVIDDFRRYHPKISSNYEPPTNK